MDTNIDNAVETVDIENTLPVIDGVLEAADEIKQDETDIGAEGLVEAQDEVTVH